MPGRDVGLLVTRLALQPLKPREHVERQRTSMATWLELPISQPTQGLHPIIFPAEVHKIYRATRSIFAHPAYSVYTEYLHCKHVFQKYRLQ